ncbi:hypothetical protein GPECTOR_1g760 [Gonium pectorale]|uniref:Uncharacterized protein n=1 Tax=Gonium pectorale TaxID=33097 RepID=A0A150H452_GONPE|nr:hypothetical protein GPECTOR_1g760 [Gonium pectorale]|eukprot:KXZ56843.1 hypothetical protein GPECTOR_1g760 [Gonium pectorale]
MAQLARTPGSARLLLAPELIPSYDDESLRSIGKQQLLEAWKAWLPELSVLLLKLETQPDDEPAAERMRKLLAENAFLFRHASVLAPEAMMSFMQAGSTHMEAMQIAAPPPGYWQKVTKMLDLTAEQVMDLSAVYSIFNELMERVMAERRSLKAQMFQDSQAQAAGPWCPTPLPTVSPEQGTLKYFELLPALERNMRKESAAHLLVRGFVFGRTLSWLQFSRAAVHAYPFFPSATGIAAAAAGVPD